jgi:hypothetical protein
MWWPGKRLVPLLPLQAVKGDQNGYPVPKVWLGHPDPGVTNAVDWPFKLGLGDRPTAYHRKKAVRNLNCGLGKVRLSGIDLRIGKLLMRWG